jgi:hypothetical protein
MLDETLIDIAGTATFRRIAGDVSKITFFLAGRADSRRRGSCDNSFALAAFPVGIPAFRTQIVEKVTIGGVTAMPAHLFIGITYTAFRADIGGCFPDVAAMRATFDRIAQGDLLFGLLMPIRLQKTFALRNLWKKAVP